MKKLAAAGLLAGTFLLGMSLAGAGEHATVARTGTLSLEVDNLEASVEVAQPSILIATGFIEGTELAPDAHADNVGVGIDLYVDGERCTIARDIRSGVRPEFFEDKFGATATCIKRLDVGKHVLGAHRVSPGVRNAQITLTWSLSHEEDNSEEH